MDFLKGYKYKQLEDGCVMLDIVPVENYEDIFVCVNPTGENLAIFDGGSTLASLYMVYNFNSQEVCDKFVDICKKYRLSKRGNVLVIECQKQDFKTRLDDFIQALNEICNI